MNININEINDKLRFIEINNFNLDSNIRDKEVLLDIWFIEDELNFINTIYESQFDNITDKEFLWYKKYTGDIYILLPIIKEWQVVDHIICDVNNYNIDHKKTYCYIILQNLELDYKELVNEYKEEEIDKEIEEIQEI